jgi:CTP synthase
MANGIDAMTETVRIALVGKYTGLSDSYLSVYKALKHAAIAVGRTLVVDWVDASLLEPVVPRTASATPDRPRRGSLAKEASNGASGEASQRMPSQNADAEARKAHDDAWARLEAADGILVPGGFGSRGVEGKILAANFARENNIPYFGICLGFQCMVIEFCRNVVGLTGANSTEFDEKAKHPAVVFMPEISTERMGGTMRLGSRRTVLQPSKDPNAPPSLAAMLYGDVKGVMERHRHRYEVNPELVDQIEAKGLRFTGKDDRGERMEIAELPRSEHPFFFGCQYHPEFKTQPQKPSPPFLGLILASIGQLSSHLDELAQPQQ